MKVCSKCNNQVADELSFCPNCGNKLDEGNQAPSVDNVQPTIEPSISPVPDAPVAPEVPSVEPVDAPVQQTTFEQQTPEQPTPEQPSSVQPAPVQQPAGNKGGKTILIIVLAVVVVLLIVLCVVFGLKALGSKSDDGGNTGNGDIEDVEPSGVSDAANTASYNGYNFTVPDGFTTEEDAKYGLKFLSSSLVFSVLEDSTNTFTDYYNAFVAEYPSEADKLVQELEGHKYILLLITDTNGDSAVQYVYDSNEGFLFSGILGNASLSRPTAEELTTLHKVLTSAKRSSSFAPGDAVDSGKDGLIKLQYDKDAFKTE